MFTHPLPISDQLYKIEFTDYAKRHFLKDFQKKYKGKQWQVTEDSIRQDLMRIANGTSDLQKTQQVDELWSDGRKWLFKYDFRIAGTNQSTKASGNRLVAAADADEKTIEIILIYAKTNLPKNMGETQYIKSVVSEMHDDNTDWR